MSRSTVDFGIDLGTTNSSISVLKGRDTEVIKNNHNSDTTPSVVYINKQNELCVGRTAKERVDSDPENAFQEFKRKMGTSEPLVFKRSGRKMLPEELSAEVLKQLRSDVRERTGEDVRAAVITVPADFELPQNEATQRAARMAGLELSPLLQEPVAAALAYGFNSESNKVYWLVYDFGGGTFDAALIQVRDGNIQVVNHGGDNYLGGKDVDWGIVEQLFIPALTSNYNLPDFKRGNPKWFAAVAKLKFHAEEAKIRLSREQSFEVMLNPLCLDADGNTVEFEYRLKREEVEGIIEPLVRRSINKCRQVLSERNLDPKQVSKLVLVGGPTMTPYLRGLLADAADGLGIPIDHTVDPLTIVARGAACFAGAQRVEGVGKKAAAGGRFGLELSSKFKNIGSDPEPLVGGRVIAPDGRDLAGYSLVLVNKDARPPWRSGRIAVKGDGSFVAQLLAQKNVNNTFTLELAEPSGDAVQIDPASFNYTVGLVINEQPLIHSIGIGLANNDVSWLFRKGAGLPQKKTDRDRRTARVVRVGQKDDAIRIPIVEGEKERADRNTIIGDLRITGDQIRRDLPANSEIEVTIEIDASRLIKTHAYVPILDQEFEGVIHLSLTAVSPEKLAAEYKAELARHAQLSDNANRTGEAYARQLLEQITSEGLLEKIPPLFDAARTDAEAANQANKCIRDLRSHLDEVEDALHWPVLLAELREKTQDGREWFGKVSDRSEERTFETLVREAEQAVQTRQSDLLRRKLSEMGAITQRLLFQIPDFWIAHFQKLEGWRSDMANQTHAKALFEQGTRSINSGDIAGLSAAVRQLYSLLPEEEQKHGGIGDII